VSGFLDMRRGKHSLHFVVDNELLPHAIVNIPNNEKIHIGVFHIFSYYFIYLFIYFYLLYYFIYLFILLFIYLFIYLYFIIHFILFIYLLCSFLLFGKSP
jgi:hypothetical protein